MIDDEKVAAVRAIPLPTYFQKVMPIVDADLSDIWSDLLDVGKSLCPFHEERTASFRYKEATNTCYCFGCRTGGDIIYVHRLLFNLRFEEAVDALYSVFIGEDADASSLKLLKLEEQESKADLLVYNHMVLDRVTKRNFQLAEDLSLLIRMRKIKGNQAMEYYNKRKQVLCT